MPANRHTASGVCYGASLEADPLRIHEWHRAYSIDQPTAEAPRVLDRCRRSLARSRADCPRHTRRTDELDVIRNRRRHTRSDSFAQSYKRIPGLLLAVVAATIVVGILNLDATASVKVLGPLPQGPPSFSLPMISFAHLDEVIVGGC